MAKTEDITFISILRAVAVLLVIWDHLIGIFVTRNKINLAPVKFVQDYVNTPLGIIQDFGFFGVVMFFFISGFIITYTAQNENYLSFGLKRFFRIYPPYLVSLFVIVVVNQIYLMATNVRTEVSSFTIGEFLLTTVLGNFFVPNSKNLNGVAWTLIIEVIFYAFCFATLYFIKHKPRIAQLLLLAICALVMLLCRSFGASFFLFSISVSFVPFMLAGQSLYYLWTKRIKLWECAIYTTACYLLVMTFIKEVNKAFYPVTNSYGVSFVLAYLVLIICLLVNDRLKLPPVLKLFSDTSYSMYLYHGSVGLLLLGGFTPVIGFVGALALTLPVIVLVSYLGWKYIERPNQKLARILIKKFSPKPVEIKPPETRLAENSIKEEEEKEEKVLAK
jgi:peptidoglycan/LPS O-acetylase OafA/YrhL